MPKSARNNSTSDPLLPEDIVPGSALSGHSTEPGYRRCWHLVTQVDANNDWVTASGLYSGKISDLGKHGLLIHRPGDFDAAGIPQFRQPVRSDLRPTSFFGSPIPAPKQTQRPRIMPKPKPAISKKKHGQDQTRH